MNGEHLPGVFVVSLDFELAWGVRDHLDPQGPYRSSLLGARTAVSLLLEVFREFEISATWAVVGFLFASSRRELEQFTPTNRPNYADASLSPYDDHVGDSEADDPIHFAPSLIEGIRLTPRQEIATHTFSHFYCLEKGQDRKAFRADLEAARAIAEQKGIQLKSIVFPRNQHNPAYDDVLLESGITAYRGSPEVWSWQSTDAQESRSYRRRVMRLADSYLNITGAGTTSWADVLQPNGLSNVRASRLLRPHSPKWRMLEPLRLKRLRQDLRRAAQNREIFHLWWHPHNFGRNLEQNLSFLHNVLEEVNRCRERYGMLSLSMAHVDELARRRTTGGEQLSSALRSRPYSTHKSLKPRIP